MNSPAPSSLLKLAWNAQADTQYTDRIKIALDDSGGGVDIDPGVYRSGDPSTTTWMCILLTVVSGL